MEIRVERPRGLVRHWAGCSAARAARIFAKVGGSEALLPANFAVDLVPLEAPAAAPVVEVFSREGAVSCFLGAFKVPATLSAQGVVRFEEFIVNGEERVAKVKGSVKPLPRLARQAQEDEGVQSDTGGVLGDAANIELERLIKALEAVSAAEPVSSPPTTTAVQTSSAVAETFSPSSPPPSRRRWQPKVVPPSPPVRTAFRGFTFEPRTGPVDWARVAATNTRRLERDGDIKSLDAFMPDIAFGSVDFDSIDVNSGHAKGFELSQLSVQYLLHCRELLRGRVMTLEKGVHALELQATADIQKERAARHRLHRLRQESRKQSKVLSTYQTLLRVHNPALAARTFLEEDGGVRLLSQAEVDAATWLDDGLRVEGDPLLPERLLSWRRKQRQHVQEEEEEAEGFVAGDVSPSSPVIPTSGLEHQDVHRDQEDPGPESPREPNPAMPESSEPRQEAEELEDGEVLRSPASAISYQGTFGMTEVLEVLDISSTDGF